MSRRTTLMIAVALSATMLAGCVPDVPEPATAESPQASAAVVQSQIDRIVPATMTELAAADEAADASLLTDRVTGTAATVRAAEYKIAKADENDKPDLIPDTMQAVYVSSAEDFPRVMVAVSEQPEDETTPVVLLWIQEDVDSDYRMVDWAHMIPGATLPAMPGAATGAEQLSLDDDSLAATPRSVVEDYLELLRQGPDGELADTFEPDTYRDRIFDARKKLTDAVKESEGTYLDTVQSDFDHTYVLGTAEGGALVFAPVTIDSSFAVAGGSTVSVSATDKALLEGEVKDKFTTHYLDLLVFHIPADAEAKPAVVAADHHAVKVTAD